MKEHWVMTEQGNPEPPKSSTIRGYDYMPLIDFVDQVQVSKSDEDGNWSMFEIVAEKEFHTTGKPNRWVMFVIWSTPFTTSSVTETNQCSTSNDVKLAQRLVVCFQKITSDNKEDACCHLGSEIYGTVLDRDTLGHLETRTKESWDFDRLIRVLVECVTQNPSSIRLVPQDRSWCQPIIDCQFALWCELINTGTPYDNDDQETEVVDYDGEKTMAQGKHQYEDISLSYSSSSFLEEVTLAEGTLSLPLTDTSRIFDSDEISRLVTDEFKTAFHALDRDLQTPAYIQLSPFSSETYEGDYRQTLLESNNQASEKEVPLENGVGQEEEEETEIQVRFSECLNRVPSLIQEYDGSGGSASEKRKGQDTAAECEPWNCPNGDSGAEDKKSQNGDNADLSSSLIPLVDEEDNLVLQETREDRGGLWVTFKLPSYALHLFCLDDGGNLGEVEDPSVDEISIGDSQTTLESVQQKQENDRGSESADVIEPQQTLGDRVSKVEKTQKSEKSRRKKLAKRFGKHRDDLDELRDRLCQAEEESCSFQKELAVIKQHDQEQTKELKLVQDSVRQLKEECRLQTQVPRAPKQQKNKIKRMATAQTQIEEGMKKLEFELSQCTTRIGQSNYRSLRLEEKVACYHTQVTALEKSHKDLEERWARERTKLEDEWAQREQDMKRLWQQQIQLLLENHRTEQKELCESWFRNFVADHRGTMANADHTTWQGQSSGDLAEKTPAAQVNLCSPWPMHPTQSLRDRVVIRKEPFTNHFGHFSHRSTTDTILPHGAAGGPTVFTKPTLRKNRHLSDSLC